MITKNIEIETKYVFLVNIFQVVNFDLFWHIVILVLKIKFPIK